MTPFSRRVIRYLSAVDERDIPVNNIRKDQYARPNGKDCRSAYGESGFQFEGAIAGENIARAYQASDGMAAAVRGFNLLKVSPAHNRNMLNPGMTHMSFSLLYDSHTGYLYTVHFFARPAR